MMINKENDDNDPVHETDKESGIVDVARMDVQCHIIIKDSETGDVLLNTRG
jgi:hypothetical protein